MNWKILSLSLAILLLLGAVALLVDTYSEMQGRIDQLEEERKQRDAILGAQISALQHRVYGFPDPRLKFELAGGMALFEGCDEKPREVGGLYLACLKVSGPGGDELPQR